LIDRTRGVDLREGIEMFAVDCDRLSVEDEFDIGISAGSAHAKLLRPTQQQLAGTGELNLLQVGRDDLDIRIECSRDSPLACDLIGHRLQDLGRIILRPSALRHKQENRQHGGDQRHQPPDGRPIPPKHCDRLHHILHRSEFSAGGLISL
jgi:hypothetical protein